MLRGYVKTGVRELTPLRYQHVLLYSQKRDRHMLDLIASSNIMRYCTPHDTVTHTLHLLRLGYCERDNPDIVDNDDPRTAHRHRLTSPHTVCAAGYRDLASCTCGGDWAYSDIGVRVTRPHVRLLPTQYNTCSVTMSTQRRKTDLAASPTCATY